MKNKFPYFHMKKLIFTLSILVFSSVISGQNSDDPTLKIESIISQIELPRIGNFTILVTKLGALGDSISDSKPAFDKAMDLCKKKNGGTIIVPKGVYLLNGPIHFVNHVKLHLQKGAVIRFNDRPEFYLPKVLTSWEGTFLFNYSPLIYAYNCHDIAITGEGTIDGEGSRLWDSYKEKEGPDKLLSREMNHLSKPLIERQFGENHYLRPQLIQFYKCKNILVEDVRIEDAPFWCLHLLKSESATIRGVKYYALNHNNDGIDPEYSKNILIENIQFDNGDDNIAIKAGRDHEGRANFETPSENIIIRNCSFKGLHGVVLGSELSAGIRNIYIQNCKSGGYLKRGIYFKTNADRGGYIENIDVRNIKLDRVEDCLYVTANYQGEGSGFATKISNVVFKNITCNNASETGIVLQGYAQNKIKSVLFDHIEIKSAKYGMTITNSERVEFNEVIIGQKAVVPTAIK